MTAFESLNLGNNKVKIKMKKLLNRLSQIVILFVIFEFVENKVDAQQLSQVNENDFFGAEYNPTGNPIGGLIGYSNIVTRKDYIVSSKEELLTALKNAKSGDVVYVEDNAEIDLTKFEDYDQISIPGGVTLASGRGSVDNDGNLSYGALLFTNEFESQLFITGGDSVRITGLRLKGPDPYRHKTSYGIPNSDCITINHPFAEVDNCEIWAWSHGAVQVFNGLGKGRVFVHHNFIHHNRRDGLGYGVVIGNASALVEANIFSDNRHSVAGSGEKESSYEAKFNICYGDTANKSHTFDMHGGADLQDGTNRAGSIISIHHNTFYSAVNTPIVVRGIPNIQSSFHHNWFVNLKPESAVSQMYANENMKIFRNAYGSNKKVMDTEKPKHTW